MRIDTGASYAFLNKMQSPSQTPSSKDASFEGVLAGTNHAPATKVDFSNMTRKDLIDWVNGQIRSGAMSLDGTETFVSMTARVEIGSGSPGLENSERVNFFEVARSGIEFYLSRGEQDAAARWQDALGVLERAHGRLDFHV